jgi:hypothetical protein
MVLVERLAMFWASFLASSLFRYSSMNFTGRKNPKSQYLNAKQIRNPKAQSNLEFWILVI